MSATVFPSSDDPTWWLAAISDVHRRIPLKGNKIRFHWPLPGHLGGGNINLPAEEYLRHVLAVLEAAQRRVNELEAAIDVVIKQRWLDRGQVCELLQAALDTQPEEPK